MAESERIQKILAQAGIASRRKAEELIEEGVVTVNGKVARLGDKALFGKDAIKVRGKLIHTKESPIYLAFHKPKGVISMFSDPEGRPTIGEFLKKGHTRVFPIGRLDFNSEGLILLTNDGDFAEKMQKRADIPRVYHVKVQGHPTQEDLTRLRRPGRIGTRRVQPYSVRLIHEYSSKAMIEIVILGSGALDLKAFFNQRRFLVDRTIRVSIGHITLKRLLPGQYRQLTQSQAIALLNQPELGMRLIEHTAATSRRA